MRLPGRREGRQEVRLEMRELKRLCLPCAGKLQDGGIRCECQRSAGGGTGHCASCGARRLCFTWEINYEAKGDNHGD